MKQRFKQLGYAVASVLVVIGLLHIRSCVKGTWERPGSHNPPIPTLLKPQDKEVVLYNDNTHQVTTVTKTETKTEYSRNPEVHIQDNETVLIARHLSGLEVDPFLGLGYGDGPRVHLGLSWFYFWKFDLNTQLAFTLDDSKAKVTVIPVVSMSYTFWRNTAVFLGINPVDFILQRPTRYQAGILLRF